MIGLFAPLTALAIDEARGRLRRQGAMVAGYGLAAVGLLGMAGVGLVSLHRYCAALWDPFRADLAIAGVFFVVALIGWLVALIAAARPTRDVAQLKAEAVSAAAAGAAPLAASLSGRGGGVGLVGALAAVALGVMAGRAATKKD